MVDFIGYFFLKLSQDDILRNLEFPAAYVDWIDGFIRFNGIRIVTKWASALCAGVIPNCKHYPTIDASALETLKISLIESS